MRFYFPAILAFCAAVGPAAGQIIPEGVVTTDLAAPTVWTPCAWDLAAGDNLAECARITVPRDHANPSGPGIVLALKRRLAEGPARAVVWLVHGGPGASATAGMVDLAHDIPQTRRDISFYAVDHRGTGGSDRLGCARAEAPDSSGGTLIIGREWNSCLRGLRWTRGTALVHFSAEAAAADLAVLIDKYRDAAPVFVYGASYGTYMVRHYLARTTAPPDGVILEGIVAPDGGMTGYDSRFDVSARAFLATCDAAPACARHFDGPLGDTLSQLFARVDDGHCAALRLDAAVLRQWLAALAIYHDTRLLIPPLVHRIGRCDADDLRFLARFAANLTDQGPDGSYSAVLHNHIALSEMYSPHAPDTAAASRLHDQFAAAVLSTGLEATYVGLYHHWPRYGRKPPPAPDFAGPVLGLHGGLDAPAPLAGAQAAFAAFDAPHQNLVIFPQGAHGVVGATPVADGFDCAMAIMLGFIDEPEVPLDTGCIARITPLDWQEVPPATAALVGTANLWEGP